MRKSIESLSRVLLALAFIALMVALTASVFKPSPGVTLPDTGSNIGGGTGGKENPGTSQNPSTDPDDTKTDTPTGETCTHPVRMTQVSGNGEVHVWSIGCLKCGRMINTGGGEHTLDSNGKCTFAGCPMGCTHQSNGVDTLTDRYYELSGTLHIVAPTCTQCGFAVSYHPESHEYNAAGTCTKCSATKQD